MMDSADFAGVLAYCFSVGSLVDHHERDGSWRSKSRPFFTIKLMNMLCNCLVVISSLRLVSTVDRFLASPRTRRDRNHTLYLGSLLRF